MENDRSISATWRSLARSPLLDGMHARENKGMAFLKLLGSGVVGLVGGGIASVVVFILLLLVTLVALGANTDVLGEVLNGLQSGEPPQTLELAIGLLVALAVMNSALMVGFVLLASILRKRRFKDNITRAPRFRWSQLFVGLFGYGAAFAAMIAVEATFLDMPLEWPVLQLTDSAAEIAVYALSVTAAFIVAAFAEEILFRGWLLRETSVFTRRVAILLLVNGVLFAAIHFNPSNFELDPNAFIARTIMGVVFCYMALRFGGIEFATGAHAANNILLTLIVQPMAFTEAPAEPLQAGLFAESLILLAMGIAVTEACARLPMFQRMQEEPAPVADTFN